MREQLAQLRKLPAFYPLPEAPHVERAVEAYINAQVPFESNQQSAVSSQQFKPTDH
jgi:hypothetical protein